MFIIIIYSNVGPFYMYVHPLNYKYFYTWLSWYEVIISLTLRRH